MGKFKLKQKNSCNTNSDTVKRIKKISRTVKIPTVKVFNSKKLYKRCNKKEILEWQAE
jgi:ribosomal protein L7Ae-like RNA K-turn-binding protein